MLDLRSKWGFLGMVFKPLGLSACKIATAVSSQDDSMLKIFIIIK